MMRFLAKYNNIRYGDAIDVGELVRIMMQMGAYDVVYKLKNDVSGIE
jgi:hypothetical protein